MVDGGTETAALWFLVRLISDPEDGGHTLLRNVVHIRTTRRYTAEDGNMNNFRVQYECVISSPTMQPSAPQGLRSME
jgi:hypothetical protein